MKAAIALLGSALKKGLLRITLLSLIFLVYPEISQAASLLQNQPTSEALVFEIKPTPKDEVLLGQSTYQKTVGADPLVSKVRNYLKQKNSPLAEYAEEIVKQPQWQRAIAITSVESNYCGSAANYNCGSLGVRPSHPAWRKYETALDGFKDITVLLEKPIYKERFTDCKSMRGIYVVPGSLRWVAGCESASNELITLTNQAETEQLALSNKPFLNVAPVQLAFAR